MHKKLLLRTFLFLILTSCGSASLNIERQEINRIINNWHQAASKADEKASLKLLVKIEFI